MDEVSKRIAEIWYETKILRPDENKNKHYINKEIADKISSNLSDTSIVEHSVNFDSLYDVDLEYYSNLITE